MSFLSSLLNVFSDYTISIKDGFPFLPATKLRLGSAFRNMGFPVNFTDVNGIFQLGQEYGSNSALAQPKHEGQPKYQPQGTDPPRAWPTHQPDGYEVPLGMNETSMYSFSAEGMRALKAYERLSQRPYFVNGQKFIGYGHKLDKNDNTSYISLDQAEAFLTQDVGAVVGMVKGAISTKITQGQFDAMVDFAFTMDASTFKSSDVVAKLSGGDISGACTALMQWCYGKQNGFIQRFEHLTARRTNNVHWMTQHIDPQSILTL